MTTRKREQQTTPYEVLVRRQDGHETVVRVQAAGAADAREQVRERFGLAPEFVVEASAV